MNMEDNLLNLRDYIYQYQCKICHFNQMQVLSTSPKEKNYYLNLIDERTEALNKYISEILIKAQETEPNVNQEAEPNANQETEPNLNQETEPDLIQEKEFTIEELSNYDGTNGKDAYVAINGIVYDLSNIPRWAGGMHFGLFAGKDLTGQFSSCHRGFMEVLNTLPKVGVLGNRE